MYGIIRGDDMIYLDNAATTVQKPSCVAQAVAEAITFFGNSGRSAHNAALSASRTVFETRKLTADFFNAENPERIAFTANSTQALNIAIKGILKNGDHVITTELEHNSVLRPLYEMEQQGVELSFVKSDKYGRIYCDDFEKLIRENTKAIVCTHASNLTGNVVDIGYIGRIAKKHGIVFIVDASQTAGVFPIDVQSMGIDVLCFTGHKGLLGPQGTGGMYVREGIEIKPLLSGGSGVQSYSKTHPQQMPAALEAGTLNSHGIAGLAAAIKYINNTGIDSIRKKEQQCMWAFYNGIKDIDGVKIYGDFSSENRCAIVAVNIWDYDSEKVSDVLFEEYGIATRPGAHCAPLMHTALDTAGQGAVRFSFSHFNTLEDVRCAVEAVKNIAE